MIQFTKEKRYVEQSKGYKHSSYIVELDDGCRAIDEDLFGIPLVQGAFQSVFSLDKSVKELVDSTGSISGYCGVCHTDYIHWDFDSDVDLSKSIGDAKKLCERMESMGIDAGYRGEITAAFRHFDFYEYTKGQRLVQICAPNLGPIKIVALDSELDETERGSGGFGSTGL